MKELDTRFAALEAVCADPGAQLRAAVSAGRKVVGVLPYFCPEELVYAAGMLPMGLWGAEMQANESKRYYPAFICSILHTVLELGLKGALNALSAVMIPISCDSLKGMAANWEYGVRTVPVINVAYAENRKTAAGAEFTRSQFRKILGQLEKLSGRSVTDAEIARAVAVYNENRAALRAFCAAAAKHPEAVPPARRSAVIKAGYFMDRAEHTQALYAVTEALNALPEREWDGLRIVTTGILADSPALLKILGDNRIAVCADQVAQESMYYGFDTPVTGDPVVGMAERLGCIEGCSVLFDPGKRRGHELVALARAAKADGILWVMTKFCDPEEYDYVPVKRMIDAAGIPLLTVEVDQQMVNYEQARSAVEAFAEVLRS